MQTCETWATCHVPFLFLFFAILNNAQLEVPTIDRPTLEIPFYSMEFLIGSWPPLIFHGLFYIQYEYFFIPYVVHDRRQILNLNEGKEKKWFVKGQTYFSTSWHANMRLILNRLMFFFQTSTLFANMHQICCQHMEVLLQGLYKYIYKQSTHDQKSLMLRRD